jgi:serine/threonine protein kinase
MEISDKYQSLKESLIKEIKVMDQVKDKKIIELKEVYEGSNHIYMVMELLEGGSLYDNLITKGQHSEQESFQVFSQLLQAITAVHVHDMMHRDIKPENFIYVNKQSQELKLVEFGLTENIHNPTKLFVRCGTPGYIAPEIFNDSLYDCKVDIFSAGIILYNLYIFS